MTSIKTLVSAYSPPPQKATKSKVTVVGAGQVGLACVFSILTQGVSPDVAIIDMVEDRLMGELLDLQHGGLFLHSAHIQASTEYSITAGSRLCIITAGARQKEGESRLSLVQRNTDIMKGIIPQLVKYSPDTIIMMVSNPVDILTYVAWKVSGLPKNRIIGSGTNLDSARFRVLLSQKLQVAPRSCHAWIIGEHGDTSIAVWSGANIAGVRLCSINPNVGAANDPDNFAQLHEEVVQAAYKIIKLKGYTSWAIGLSVAALTRSILNNTHNVHAVSVCVKDEHGIKDEVFLSLPCVLTQEGISGIIKQDLNESEIEQLHTSAKLMKEVQDNLKI